MKLTLVFMSCDGVAESFPVFIRNFDEAKAHAGDLVVGLEMVHIRPLQPARHLNRFLRKFDRHTINLPLPEPFERVEK